jgi:hypothetical protein
LNDRPRFSLALVPFCALFGLLLDRCRGIATNRWQIAKRIVEFVSPSIYFYIVSTQVIHDPWHHRVRPPLQKSHPKVWFNRHFSCVAKVIRELRKCEETASFHYVVSHRRRAFSGFETADSWLIEPNDLPSGEYLDWVVRTVEMHAIDCLVPGHEQSLLTQNANRFTDVGCRLFQAAPPEVIANIHHKDWVYKQVANWVPLPQYASVDNALALQHAVESLEAKVPEVCLKPVLSVYGLGFGRITARKEFARQFRPTVESWLQKLGNPDKFARQLVMEYLPGHEYSVDVAARGGSLMAAVIRRKPLIQAPQLIVDHPELLRLTAWLVDRFQLNGLINVQFREDRLGNPKLLEINPRASGGIAMSCQAEINLPAIAYRAFFEPDWLPDPSVTATAGIKVWESPEAQPQPLSAAAELHVQNFEVESVTSALTAERIALPTGELTVNLVQQSSFPAEVLLGFGARDNRKRGFLFVSRVLGKHIAVAPSTMRLVHQELANKLVEQGRFVGGSGVVIGMAETATGLGFGVFEQLQLNACTLQWQAYFQTTRYPCAAENSDEFLTRLDFEEQHSHATKLHLELPPVTDPCYQLLTNAESVCLVDDEISTGRTFFNLLRTLRGINPSLKRVFIATLTDLSGGKVQALLNEIEGIESVAVASLLAGTFQFESKTLYEVPVTNVASKETIASVENQWSTYSARQGRLSAPCIPQTIIVGCLAQLAPGRCRVVGTNECMDPAYRLALELESHGLVARVQSTTRSPLLLSHDIEAVLPVIDPYSPSTPNYIYNFELAADENLIVVHESTNKLAVARLLQSLAADGVCLEVNLLDETVVRHDFRVTSH